MRQGLRAWAVQALPSAVLPRAAPDGSNVLSAIPAAVQRLAAAAAPGVIVFVEDDWQVSRQVVGVESCCKFRQCSSSSAEGTPVLLSSGRLSRGICRAETCLTRVLPSFKHICSRQTSQWLQMRHELTVLSPCGLLLRTSFIVLDAEHLAHVSAGGRR